MVARVKQLALASFVFALALTIAAIASWAQESRLVRTGQMWGSELAEGKVTATLGIAGECTQRPDRTLTCQFASIGVSDDGQCVVSAWSERFRPLRKTSDIATWAGARGPEGLGGVMSASTLTAERSALANSKTDLFDTSGPGSYDGWSYKSIQSFSAPSLGGKVLPTMSTEVKNGSPRPLRCNNTVIMAISPIGQD